MAYFRSKKEPYYALNVRSNSAKEAISFKYQTYRVKQFMKLAYDETEEIQEDYPTILGKTGLRYRNKKHYAWYCLSAIEDNIYYWSTLELRKSLGESLEREKYRSNQGNLWMQKMLQSNPTMSKRQIAVQQIFASSLDAFEEKYIEYNKNFFLAHLYSDYDLDENEF